MLDVVTVDAASPATAEYRCADERDASVEVTDPRAASAFDPSSNRLLRRRMKLSDLMRGMMVGAKVGCATPPSYDPVCCKVVGVSSARSRDARLLPIAEAEEVGGALAVGNTEPSKVGEDVGPPTLIFPERSDVSSKVDIVAPTASEVPLARPRPEDPSEIPAARSSATSVDDDESSDESAASDDNDDDCWLSVLVSTSCMSVVCVSASTMSSRSAVTSAYPNSSRLQSSAYHPPSHSQIGEHDVISAVQVSSSIVVPETCL